MYDFEPTEEQRMLVDAVRRYASTDLRPASREADEEGVLPSALVEKGWDLGVLQASIPEEYGGFGEYSAVTGVLAGEEMAWGDLAGAIAVMLPASYAFPILKGGTEEQKKEWLPPVVEAEWKPYVAALIEPKFDFHAFDLSTTAQKRNGGYVLNGQKAYVPFAPEAPAFLVYAALNGETRCFVVPAGTDGLTVGEREKLMGVKALPSYSLLLEDVEVPAGSLVGGESGGSTEEALAACQVAMAALAVGMSRGAYEYALEYAKEREAFGQFIAQKQAIAFMLAEMVTEIEAIRLLIWEAAWMLDEGKEEAAKQAYLAYVGASDMAMMVTDRAVQILGGHGYVRDHPVELWMRNGRGIATFAGLAAV